MSDIEFSADEVDKWQDQIHDLRIDLRKADSDAIQLQHQIDELEKEILRHQEMVRIMGETHQAHIKDMDAMIHKITNENKTIKDEQKCLSIKFLRALAGIRTVAVGNFDYFKTTKGEDLLNWSQKEIIEYQQKTNGGT